MLQAYVKFAMSGVTREEVMERMYGGGKRRRQELEMVRREGGNRRKLWIRILLCVTHTHVKIMYSTQQYTSFHRNYKML